MVSNKLNNSLTIINNKGQIKPIFYKTKMFELLWFLGKKINLIHFIMFDAKNSSLFTCFLQKKK